MLPESSQETIKKAEKRTSVLFFLCTKTVSLLTEVTGYDAMV
ncbi:hypothetical protein ADIAL_1472 [Alkalibacterium sp. AK22]|nr:hypothetical protein ADIAL_1472 [Alkalibacterium sp. AK22]